MEVIGAGQPPREKLLPGIFRSIKVSWQGLEVIELEIAPGSRLQPHDMPCRVAFYVLEGEGVFTCAGRPETLRPQDMVTALPGQERFWANPGTVPLRLLVIKSLTETRPSPAPAHP